MSFVESSLRRLAIAAAVAIVTAAVVIRATGTGASTASQRLSRHQRQSQGRARHLLSGAARRAVAGADQHSRLPRRLHLVRRDLPGQSRLDALDLSARLVSRLLLFAARLRAAARLSRRLVRSRRLLGCQLSRPSVLWRPGQMGRRRSPYGEGATNRGAFYNRLAPYGNWIWLQGQYVWVPQNVGPAWRPYTVGRWVFTDRYGWMWVLQRAVRLGDLSLRTLGILEPGRLVLGAGQSLGAGLGVVALSRTTISPGRRCRRPMTKASASRSMRAACRIITGRSCPTGTSCPTTCRAESCATRTASTRSCVRRSPWAMSRSTTTTWS